MRGHRSEAQEEFSENIDRSSKPSDDASRPLLLLGSGYLSTILKVCCGCLAPRTAHRTLFHESFCVYLCMLKLKLALNVHIFRIPSPARLLIRGSFVVGKQAFLNLQEFPGFSSMRPCLIRHVSSLVPYECHVFTGAKGRRITVRRKEIAFFSHCWDLPPDQVCSEHQ